MPEIVEEYVKVYFDNRTMRVFRAITRYVTETWIRLELQNGQQIILNPDKINFYITKGREHVK